MRLDEAIIDTLVTWTMVEEDIQRDYHTQARTGPNRKAVYLGDANGYISKCALVTFDWTTDRERLPQQGIMKIVTCERFHLLTQRNEAYDNVLEQAALFNDCEVHFYKNLSTLPPADRPDVPVPNYICGRSFGVDGVEAGYCILEKLEDFHNVHIYHNLDEKAALDGVKTLAKLTIYSIKHPKFARKVAETEAFDVHFRDFTTIPKSKKGLEICGSRFPDKIKEIEKIMTVLPVFQSIDTFREAMLRNIKMPLIVHGDMWPGNILWRKSSDGQLTVKAVVDWQLLHLGNPCEDIVRFLAKALSGQEYREKRDYYLRVYYTALRDELEAIQLPWSTFEQFVADYERIYPLIFTAWLPPFIRLVSEEQIKGGHDAEALKRGESFKQKFQGMVDEAVRCIDKRY